MKTKTPRELEAQVPACRQQIQGADVSARQRSLLHTIVTYSLSRGREWAEFKTGDHLGELAGIADRQHVWPALRALQGDGWLHVKNLRQRWVRCRFLPSGQLVEPPMKLAPAALEAAVRLAESLNALPDGFEPGGQKLLPLETDAEHVDAAIALASRETLQEQGGVSSPIRLRDRVEAERARHRFGDEGAAGGESRNQIGDEIAEEALPSGKEESSRNRIGDENAQSDRPACNLVTELVTRPPPEAPIAIAKVKGQSFIAPATLPCSEEEVHRRCAESLASGKSERSFAPLRMTGGEEGEGVKGEVVEPEGKTAAAVPPRFVADNDFDVLLSRMWMVIPDQQKEFGGIWVDRCQRCEPAMRSAVDKFHESHPKVKTTDWQWLRYTYIAEARRLGMTHRLSPQDQAWRGWWSKVMSTF